MDLWMEWRDAPPVPVELLQGGRDWGMGYQGSERARILVLVRDVRPTRRVRWSTWMCSQDGKVSD